MQISRRSEKILFMNHWKTAEMLVRLKDITAYLRDP